MHGHEVGGFAVIIAALAGLEAFDNGGGRMYIEVAIAGLSPEHLSRFQEELMLTDVLPKAPFPTPKADQLIDYIEECGAKRATRRAIMRVFGARHVTLTPEQIAVIHACDALETLELWHEHAATAGSAAEVLGD